MKRDLGAVLMAAGAVLVIAALSLFLWNQAEARRGAEAVEEVLPQLLEQTQAAVTDPIPPAPPEGGEMAVAVIEDQEYIGYLSIPALGLELPVLSSCDDARLKRAPCRYAGSVYTGGLVIAGHNYIRHFGSLKRLAPGDAVYFTDMLGQRFSYQVAALDILEPTAIEEMTAGDYALSLFTCTYGGQSRMTVRCDRVG